MFFNSKSNLFKIIISTFLLNCVSSLKYHYITSDGSIHSSTSEKFSITELSNNTVAFALYENNINKTGWANLEVQTTDGFADDIQSYMAGFLEGYITGELIELHFKNKFENYCSEKTKFCQLLKDFVEKNDKFVEKMIAENRYSDYWHQMDLVNKQIKGLESGYDLWKLHNRIDSQMNKLYFSEIFLLTIDSELSTLEEVLTPESNVLPVGHCSAIVKPLADGSDLFVAHNTWTVYNTMLRVIKKYSFAFNTLQTNKTKRISGHSVSFSSYPGLILSGDDFYVLSSGLVVQETTNENYNKTLYDFIRADNLVFEFARNIIANRLADSGKEWTDLFGQYNSGTYNNQFMIVDYNKFKRDTKVTDLPNDLLWIIEQMPGFIRAADVTHVIREQGYWASYNVPYFKDLYNISGNADMANKFGPFYGYNSTARADIFRRDQSKVSGLKTLYGLMRYNDFKNDPLSQCKHYNSTCSPPYSADLTIASRNDLNEVKGYYPIREWTHSGLGATDAKMTNSSMVWNLELLAVSGPTDTQQPPFQWSKSNLTLKHSGHPDLFNFKPVYIKWFPNKYENATDF